jgi:hypothetical protein
MRSGDSTPRVTLGTVNCRRRLQTCCPVSNHSPIIGRPGRSLQHTLAVTRSNNQSAVRHRVTVVAGSRAPRGFRGAAESSLPGRLRISAASENGFFTGQVVRVAPFSREDDSERVPDEVQVRAAGGLVSYCCQGTCEPRAGGRIPPARRTRSERQETTRIGSAKQRGRGVPIPQPLRPYGHSAATLRDTLASAGVGNGSCLPKTSSSFCDPENALIIGARLFYAALWLLGDIHMNRLTFGTIHVCWTAATWQLHMVGTVS